MTLTREQACVGSLLGTAVGDALGLAREGMSRRRGNKVFGEANGHRLIFGRGMVSDDTEHACMTAIALIRSEGQGDEFVRRLAWSLRWWLLMLPAGVGFATLRSGIKLWLGFSPEKSGVFSAGNGPAMRAPIIGVYAGTDRKLMRDLVLRSTHLTHTDPRAFHGALGAALAASLSAELGPEVPPDKFLSELTSLLRADESREFLALLKSAAESASRGQSLDDFAETLGQAKGIDGFMPHTIAAVIHCWLRHPGNFRAAIKEIVESGGDTDTTAAILGGILGAGVGPEGIPKEWIDKIIEWPRTTGWITSVAQILSSQKYGARVSPPAQPLFILVLLRNLFFLTIVLLHGFRRLLPPY